MGFVQNLVLCVGHIANSHHVSFFVFVRIKTKMVPLLFQASPHLGQVHSDRNGVFLDRETLRAPCQRTELRVCSQPHLHGRHHAHVGDV